MTSNSKDLLSVLKELRTVSDRAAFGEEHSFQRVREITDELVQSGWTREQVYFIIRELNNNYGYSGYSEPVTTVTVKTPVNRKQPKVERYLDSQTDEEILMQHLLEQNKLALTGSETAEREAKIAKSDLIIHYGWTEESITRFLVGTGTAS